MGLICRRGGLFEVVGVRREEKDIRYLADLLLGMGYLVEVTSEGRSAFIPCPPQRTKLVVVAVVGFVTKLCIWGGILVSQRNYLPYPDRVVY